MRPPPSDRGFRRKETGTAVEGAPAGATDTTNRPPENPAPLPRKPTPAAPLGATALEEETIGRADGGAHGRRPVGPGRGSGRNAVPSGRMGTHGPQATQWQVTAPHRGGPPTPPDCRHPGPPRAAPQLLLLRGARFPPCRGRVRSPSEQRRVRELLFRPCRSTTGDGPTSGWSGSRADLSLPVDTLLTTPSESLGRPEPSCSSSRSAASSPSGTSARGGALRRDATEASGARAPHGRMIIATNPTPLVSGGSVFPPCVAFSPVPQFPSAPQSVSRLRASQALLAGSRPTPA